ncbi:MAG: helix-turn-helix domain-containing protein [Stellaceae bacterium]
MAAIRRAADRACRPGCAEGSGARDHRRIERLCIEAALELTGDNRASAAEMLGLSRQGLYMKLRRYGLGEIDAEGDAPER